MQQFFRLIKIFRIALRYGLDEFIPENASGAGVFRFFAGLCFWRKNEKPRGVRLRLALEALGPIFVKFGQLLSTRRDFIPLDVADELAKLQDQVQPFSSELAKEQITKSLGKRLSDIFSDFDEKPVASASVAQVHFATLKDGREVAVKVLRPDAKKRIEEDLSLLRTVAAYVEKLWEDGRRLRPPEVVAEFDKHLHHELDLLREAANGSQLRRNFADSDLLLVPEMYWDYCTNEVIVMQRMAGIPISRREELISAGVDLDKLSRDGVEIFMHQVFRDGFFHADMHPGNVFISVTPDTFGRYIALDFGIMGVLSEHDKNYLAQNFIAFFRRDYRRVAQVHIESGWAPADTREDEFEAAIRACCEPIFDRPLKDISFGTVLLRLFETSREFNLEIQPQLVLLQKTVFNIEGLGRELNPDLDLWQTGKPYLEKWMRDRLGLTGLMERITREMPQYSQIIPELPRLLHQVLAQTAKIKENKNTEKDEELKRLIDETRRLNDALSIALYAGMGILGGFFLARLIYFIY